MASLLSRIKGQVVTPGRKARTVKFGIGRGLNFHLDLASQTQVYLGLHEREIHPWFRRLTRGVRCAIDVGAAEGEYTLFFLGTREIRRVVAFEPMDDSRIALAENMALNRGIDFSRLEIVPRFVGAIGSDTQVTLDSLLPSLSFPCLVKVDVEGAELDVLKGAPKLLATPGVSWIIETHARELEEECAALLTRSGYAVTIVKNAWWRRVVPDERPLDHNRWLVAQRKSNE